MRLLNETVKFDVLSQIVWLKGYQFTDVIFLRKHGSFFLGGHMFLYPKVVKFYDFLQTKG